MSLRKTSRVLNDDSYILGLSYGDITSCGVLLLILVLISKFFGIKSMLWPMSISLTVLVMLIPVRLKYRRKIIRDSIGYFITNGVIRVSKNN